jgi:cyclopropane-fatty-acyl-phospholipid synthase
VWLERVIKSDRVPEWLLRRAARFVVGRRLRQERGRDPADRRRFIESLTEGPIAGAGVAANDQHYEQPPGFFELVLGHRLKYSASVWRRGVSTLDAAEDATLELYAERARLADGQRVLDLGCGWGSLCLWLAERHPDSEIVAVSGSSEQRRFISARAAESDLDNLAVITADVGEVELSGRFDRIVSIEMFEHLRNYRALFERLADWLAGDGLLFVHVFAHRELAYPYEDEGPSDWMARRFFTGGIMPSKGLLPELSAPLALREQWWEPGTHYARTAEAWLANLARNRSAALAALASTVGAAEATGEYAAWKLFFIACAELFGYRDGLEWGVGHYLFGHGGDA